MDYPEGVLGKERVAPSKTPNANAKPKGKPAKILDQQDSATKRSLLRENESAKTLAQKGYDVEQSPLIEGTTKKSDYLIEGKVFDFYAPDSSKARNIASAIEKKIVGNQTQRIVLNLDDSALGMDALKNQLTNYPIDGLKEIIIIKNNQVLNFFPF